MTWITRHGKLEAAGPVEYRNGIKLKLTKEFEKTSRYFDSIPIVIDTKHPEGITLDNVVGKVNNLQVKNGDWYGDYNFDLEKTQKYPGFNLALKSQKYIPASVSDMVREEDNAHVDQVPLHVLIHPQLNPRIPGAGVYNNAKILFEDSKMEEEYLKVKAENAKLAEKVKQLEKDHEEAQLKLESSNNQWKVHYIEKIKAKSDYKDEDLKDKDLSALKEIHGVLDRTKVAANTATPPIPQGEGGAPKPLSYEERINKALLAKGGHM